MIISFSGPQSSGKSTLLNHLAQANKDSDIVFIPEVTRLIKHKYKLPINEGGTDITQLMIMAEHLQNAFNPAHVNGNVILDRCSLDGLVYTTWLYRQGLVDQSVLESAMVTFYYTIQKYDLIFYTSPHDVTLTDDGERSINADFREDITELFERELEHFRKDDSFKNKFIQLSGNVNDRLKTIQEVLSSHNLNINI